MPDLSEPSTEFMRRKPYSPIRISQLANSQGRVAVLGTIVSKDENNFTFIVDDGEAQVLIITNNQEAFSKLRESQIVRVLGKILGEGSETEILSDIIQDFSKIDKTAYFKHVAK